jgi:hypothetical protein
MSAIPLGAPQSSRAGTALVVLGLAIPVLAAMFGKITAAQAGDYTARGVGTLLGVAFLAWLATRKMSAQAKANGKIVAGILLCLVVANNVLKATHETEEAKAFLVKAIEFQERQIAKVTALNKRFEKLPMASILTPENVTTSTGRRAGKATVAQLRALIAERNSMLEAHMVEMQKIVDSMPSDAMKRGAMGPIERDKEPTRKMYADLASTQTAVADALDAILDWCAAQGATLRMHNRQLVFATVEQQTELQALVAKLSKAEEEDTKVTGQAQTTQMKAAERVARSKAEAADFLKQ